MPSWKRPFEDQEAIRVNWLAAGVVVRSQMFEESPEIYLVFTLIL